MGSSPWSQLLALCVSGVSVTETVLRKSLLLVFFFHLVVDISDEPTVKSAVILVALKTW